MNLTKVNTRHKTFKELTDLRKLDTLNKLVEFIEPLQFTNITIRELHFKMKTQPFYNLLGLNNKTCAKEVMMHFKCEKNRTPKERKIWIGKKKNFTSENVLPDYMKLNLNFMY